MNFILVSLGYLLYIFISFKLSKRKSIDNINKPYRIPAFIKKDLKFFLLKNKIIILLNIKKAFYLFYNYFWYLFLLHNP